jgi:hypothetical protein
MTAVVVLHLAARRRLGDPGAIGGRVTRPTDVLANSAAWPPHLTLREEDISAQEADLISRHDLAHVVAIEV